MVEESKKMIVDTQERLGRAVTDLRDLYVRPLISYQIPLESRWWV